LVSERDPRLERLLFLSDGVYAIALTLLAVELVLPEEAADLHGSRLLDSLLGFWPKRVAGVFRHADRVRHRVPIRGGKGRAVHDRPGHRAADRCGNP